jgi:hypothetical protein
MSMVYQTIPPSYVSIDKTRKLGLANLHRQRKNGIGAAAEFV